MSENYKKEKISSQKGSFAWELTRVQSDLFLYICSLTADTAAAQDILQDTNLKLCREAESYDKTRPFLPWARTLAYYQVLSWRKKQVRERLIFDDSLFEEVASTVNTDSAVPHVLADTLEKCLKKLPEQMHELLEKHYTLGMNIKELAASYNRRPNTVAVSLHRIRQILSDCIEKNQGGGAYVSS